jgi:hypothetical protein
MRLVAALMLVVSCNSPDARFDLAALGAGGSGGGGGGGGGGAPELEVVWALRFGGEGDQLATALATRADDVVVAANLSGTMTLGTETLTSAGSVDVLYFALDASDGGYLWHRQDGDAALQQVFGVAASTQNNEIALTGAFTGLLFGQTAGQQDTFTARANPGGDIQWVRRNSSREGLDVAIADTGTWMAVGTFDAFVDFPPGVDTLGGRDGFVQWHQPGNGNTNHLRRVGSEGEDELQAVTTDGASGVFVTGSVGGELSDPATSDAYGGESDVFVGAWSSEAELVFARTFGDSAAQQGRDVAFDRERSELVVVGDFEGSVTFDDLTLTSEGGRDAFVVRLDDTGAVLSAMAFGGASDQTATAVTIDGIGRVVVTGDFEGTITVGGLALESAGKSDVFVVRMMAEEVEQLSRYGDAETQTVADVAAGGSDTIYLLLNAQGDVTIGENVLPATDLSYDFVLAKLAP